MSLKPAETTFLLSRVKFKRLKGPRRECNLQACQAPGPHTRTDASVHVHTPGGCTAHKQAAVLHLGGACWRLWPNTGRAEA